MERLRSLGKEPDKDNVMGKILSSLPAIFSNFRTTWNLTRLSPTTSLLELQSALLAAEADMRNQKPATDSNGSEDGVALATSDGHKKKGRFKGKKSKDFVCYGCGAPGHKKADCPQQKAGYGSKGSSKKPATGGAFIVSGQKDNEWQGDTGAFCHMTSHKEWFSNLQPASIDVVVGDGTVLKGKGIGSIQVETFNSRRWEQHTLVDVVWVPQINYSLFSFGAAAQHGYSFAGDANGIRLVEQKSGRTVMTGSINNGTYLMRMRIAGDSLRALATSKNLDTLKTWHLRLGHVSTDTIKRMVREQTAIGMDECLSGEVGLCEGCCMGKMHRRPFTEKSRRECEPGEVIHGDIMGPMHVQSLGGKSYCLVFKDEATTCRRVFFLKEKSEVTECFKTLLNEIEKSKAGYSTRVFRSDGGGEFCNKQMDSILASKGIIREKTPAKTPQSNGFVERDNRTLMEMARCMLKQERLPDFLWAEALNAACYICNRVPNSRHPNSSPYEQWYCEKPAIHHLKAYGCRCYYMDLYRKHKLQSKSKRGILVGYTPATSVYRVYDPSSRKVIETREVKFDEASAGKEDVFWSLLDFSDEDAEPQDLERDSSEEPAINYNNEDDSQVEIRRGRGRPPGSKNKPREKPAPHPMTRRNQSSANEGQEAFSSRQGVGLIVKCLPDPKNLRRGREGTRRRLLERGYE